MEKTVGKETVILMTVTLISAVLDSVSGMLLIRSKMVYGPAQVNARSLATRIVVGAHLLKGQRLIHPRASLNILIHLGKAFHFHVNSSGKTLTTKHFYQKLQACRVYIKRLHVMNLKLELLLLYQYIILWDQSVTNIDQCS